MRFTASSLSFGGPSVNNMACLPSDFGIEIFAEWGSNTYWKHALDRIMEGREGSFSVHSPFSHVDVAIPFDNARLFEEILEPINWCKKYNAEFFVVHTNGHLNFPHDEAVEAEMRKRAVGRLLKLDDLCSQQGVQMVIENLGFKKGERTLFNQKQFLQIFEDAPHLKCLIDTGHALLADYNIYEIQKALGKRLIAYHIHDNDGNADQHLRICQGMVDWHSFAEGFRNFTPDAALVMEYNAAEVKDYIEDRLIMRKLIEEY